MKRIFARLVPPRRAARPLAHPRRRQRGTILLLTAVLITSMMGFMAMSIDFGFLFSARHQIQNGIDAAAIAGATGLRVAIEDAGGAQQKKVVEDLAIKYAGLNAVNRYGQEPGEGFNPKNLITIGAGDVEVLKGFDPVRVRVTTSMSVPTLFAGIFNLSTVTMSATATAALLPVDGGTGTMASGAATGNGCWRPLMLPDSFFDGTENVTLVRVLEDGVTIRKPGDLPGEYYRSRFAAGARNMPPYAEAALGSPGLSVTGLRDTQLQTEVGLKTIMGQPVSFRREVYRVANFAGSGLQPVVGYPQTIDDIAQRGYCGQIRVGQLMTVYGPGAFSEYDQLRIGLQNLKAAFTPDGADPTLRDVYRYITSDAHKYFDPNTHALIIPVLLYNPVEWAKDSTGNFTELRVTNFGLFFLQDVTNDGTITGFFVREVIGGGTPIAATNMDGDSTSFQRNWLPMAVRLISNKLD